MGSQVGPTASSSYDHGRSRVDGQDPGRVIMPGESITSRRMSTEEDTEPPRITATRSSPRITSRLDSVFLTPATVHDAAIPLAGGWRTRARSDDEESIASFASHSSLVSSASRGKKRKLVTAATLEVSEKYSSRMIDAGFNLRARSI